MKGVEARLWLYCSGSYDGSDLILDLMGACRLMFQGDTNW